MEAKAIFLSHLGSFLTCQVNWQMVCFTFPGTEDAMITKKNNFDGWNREKIDPQKNPRHFLRTSKKILWNFISLQF